MEDYSNVGSDHQSSTSYQTKPTHNLNGDQKVKRISWTIAAALVVGLFLPVSAAQADPWKIIASTPLRSMTKDQDGNMYIGSTGSSIFKIDPSGEVANIGPTGNGARWVAVDSSGNIYNVNTSDGTVSKITPAGVIKNDFGATGAGSRPFKLAVDTAGNVFTLNVGNRTVSKITSAGVSTAAYLTFEEHAIPNTIATDQNDNLYVGICGDRIRTDLPLDQLDSPANLINEVRKITPSKVVTVLATTGQCPGDITIDPSGNIYTANYGAEFGWNVSKITPTGVSTILGTTGEYPVAIAIDPLGNIYTSNSGSRNVSKITPAGVPTILGSTGTASPFGILYLSGDIYTSNIDGTVSKFPLTTTTSGSAPNSQVATISTGVTGVIIPSNAALPATTLKFGGAVPTAVTVVPVATNPAPASATPFTISGSTKIVDIQITGTFNGSATVCLDGNSTDHLFHYVGGKWEELPSRTYANGQVCGVTTSFSPFAAAPVPAAPVVVYVPPTPVPYLKTLSNPQIHLVGDKFVCTAGTYNSGYTLDGVIQGSATALYTPASYTFNLLFNQIAQNPLAVTAAKNSATWSVSSAPAGALVSCSVTVAANSLKNTDSSTANPAAVSAALTTQSQSASAAESAYNAAVSANSKSYQKALVDNRATWRANVDKVRTAYFAELTRINGLPYSKANSDLKSAALKTYLAAQKKTAVDYKASGPAALIVRDLANKAALDTKTAAIVKANSVYGTFIESIGYGVLIP
jgi:sugar lactone lactonase YvrE